MKVFLSLVNRGRSAIAKNTNVIGQDGAKTGGRGGDDSTYVLKSLA